MDKKIEEYGLSILFLLIILFLMIGDCYFRLRQLGSMYIPLFLIIPVLCMIFEHISEKAMSKEQLRVWLFGAIIIGVSVIVVESFLRSSFLLGIKLGVALTLTILTAVWLSQINLFSENEQSKSVEHLGKMAESALFFCCILAPWKYELLLLNVYLCFISIYATYIYMKFKNAVILSE